MSLNFLKDFSLKSFNTFGIDAKATSFISVHSEQELFELLESNHFLTAKNVLWLGGGSNILLSQDFQGLVIHLDIKAKSTQKIDDDFSLVTASTGENWHEFVLWTLDNELGGLENLSLIPGNVGTSAIQNIGAYGVEIKDVLQSLRALDLETKEILSFDNKDCEFAYRDSYFKRNKGRFVILEISFKLSRKNHKLRTTYGAISDELAKLGLDASIQNISKAVIRIRQSKLPDPNELGNSGSFFKNPIVSKDRYFSLKEKYSDIAAYPMADEKYKLAAGWLIEQSGWKGKRIGDAGMHARQALVLVNYGNATGQDLIQLSKRVAKDVFSKFAVQIEAEVNII